ncbi:MAG TPA: hypothetical protein V6C65_35060 [Allocoleopsis sp.]
MLISDSSKERSGRILSPVKSYGATTSGVSESKKCLNKDNLADSFKMINRKNMAQQSLVNLNLQSIISGVHYFPSPIAWEDQVFYFMMLDHFSDGNENGYRDNQGNVVRTQTGVSG